MRIDPKCKIELAAAKADGGRFRTTEPYLQGDHVVATDGHIMAVVHATETGEDVDGAIPVEAVKESRKQGAVEALKGTIICNGDGEAAKLINGASFPRDTNTGFVSWRKVWPKGEPVFTVQLDVKLLWRLSQALGNSGSTAAAKGAPIALHFFAGDNGQPTDCKGIAVTVGENHGIIMPMRRPDQYRRPEFLDV